MKQHGNVKQHTPGFLKIVSDAKTRIRETNVDEIKARLDRGERLTIIDVREDHEWAGGHVPGAQHLGRGILERDVETRFPDKDAELVVYCGGGFRSALAADNLGKMGYRRVLSMDGGWRGWVERGFPVEGAPKP